MSLISQERATYDEVWSSLDRYGAHAPGETMLPIFLACVGSHRGTVLDAGCGSGKGALALQAAGFEVVLCDVSDAGLVPEASVFPFHRACLWQDLAPIARGVGHPNRTRFDYVYCCDVLEHVPTQFTMAAVEQLLRVSLRGVFLSISLVPDSFGAWLGTALHQTVQPYTWWLESFRSLTTVLESRDLLHTGIFYLEGRR